MFKNHWKEKEKRKAPKYIKSIKIINGNEFYKLIDKKNDKKIKKIIDNLYDGDFYIIRNSINKKFIKQLILKLGNFRKTNKSTFFKMKENCPNFWRRIDAADAKKYSFLAIRDSFYFFRWNKERMGLWKNFNKIWSYIKFLGGLNMNEYVKNTPKDRIIDRIQVVRYPENTGYNEPHFHTPKNQRLIISVYLSEIGKDYMTGGTYFFKSKNKIKKVEHLIKRGDVGIFYSTLLHGVDPVKINKRQKQTNLSGRWWTGLYSPESNHFTKRHTSTPLRKA